MNSVHITIITLISGICCATFANPFWLINSRMGVAEVKISMWQTMKEIYYESGIGEFYKGVIPNMILVINPIINYVIYEACKKTLTSAGFSETSAIAIFISSSAGKILATFATYPIITVRIKL